MHSTPSIEAATRLRASGQPGQARALLRTLLATEAGAAAAWLALGQCELDLGNPAAAEAALARAVELAPGQPEAHKFLADALAALDRTDAAQTHYVRAIALAPDYFQAHANLGNLLENSDPEAAIRHFQQAVRLRPDIAELHDSLGRVLRAENKGKLAQAAFLQALKLKPDLVSAHVNLARSLVGEGRHREAEAHLREALARQPGLVPARFGLADTLLALGQAGEAAGLIAGLARAEDALPPSALKLLQGRLLVAQGRHDDAVTFFQGMLAEHGDEADLRRSLWRSLSAAQAASGRPAEAFASMQTANRLRVGFDRGPLSARVQSLQALYTPARFAELPRAETARTQPVFIFGMPRAGKTLTEALLATHPAVFGLDERLAVSHLALPEHLLGQEQDRERAELALTRAELNGLATDFIDIAQEYLDDEGKHLGREVEVLVSATPGNTWKLPLIHRLFPKAPIIHVHRHPLDLGLACFFKDFANDAHAYSNDLSDLAFFILQYQALVRHWRDTLGIPMLEMRYEDMVADPAAARARIFDYIGLAGSAETLAPPPVFTDEFVGYWRQYAAQLEPLINEIGSIDPVTLEAAGPARAENAGGEH